MFAAVAAVSALAPATALPAVIRKVQIGSPIGYEKYVSGGKGYHLVKADIASGLVQADTVYAGGLATPWSLVGNVQPLAAITGTFFAPQNGIPVADVLADGELLARGNRGSILAVGHDGTVTIANRPFKRSFDWTGFKSGLRGAVRLIENGEVCPNPKAQNFKDPRIWGRASRTGVGLTHTGKLVLVATSAQVTLSDFGRAMKKKGVVEAVSLDGGSSTCLYFNGKMVLSPARKLSNMFVLKPTPMAVEMGIDF